MTKETFNQLFFWGFILVVIISLRIYFLKYENKNLKKENLLLKGGGNLLSPK